MTLTIRPARPADLAVAIDLLREANLPTADVSANCLALIAEKNTLPQGVIGVESFADVALLRSLVVVPTIRHAGVGRALVTALETLCAAESIRELWLLTIDADAFFGKLGYETRFRDDAPAAICNTAEFSGLCPGDAVLMSKRLPSF